MSTRSLCCECAGTGWIPYRSETVDGELEEAYRLCLNCQAPRACVGSKTGLPSPRPATMRYRLDCYCEGHIEAVNSSRSGDDAHQAIYYLSRCLWIARDRHNMFHYVSNFANYSVIYGSLGAAVALLLYFYISAVVLLLGAEMNAVIHFNVSKKDATEEDE